MWEYLGGGGWLEYFSKKEGWEGINPPVLSKLTASVLNKVMEFLGDKAAVFDIIFAIFEFAY